MIGVIRISQLIMPKIRKRSKSISQLKKEAWKLFSEWIRRRDADWRGYVPCITCKKIFHYKKLQAGHFIPGRHNAILFHEELVHPQCYHCNVGLRGNPREYDRFMREKYGDKKVAEFDKLTKGRCEIKQFTNEELENLIQELKDKISKL